MLEFSIIDKFFKNQPVQRSDVIHGIGDDAAVLNVPSQYRLVVSIDTLNEAVHFPKSTPAHAIGYKSLAVSLSDLAAMGAIPAWATLSISGEQLTQAWLFDFCRGFYELAQQYKVQLIGGDTNYGPLSMSVQCHGFVNKDCELLRNQAVAGDLIFVSGTLGDAGLGLLSVQDKIKLAKDDKSFVQYRLNYPKPRIVLGKKLSEIANCAIDLSDGLVSDLSHVLTASHVGATIDLNKLPLSDAMLRYYSPRQAWKTALSSGDDYELCFTVSAQKRHLIEALASEINCPLTCIGRIETIAGLRLLDENGKTLSEHVTGYQHFSE